MIERHIPTGSISLQVRAYPSEDAPLLCLHFGGGNLAMWGQALPFFQERYHVILADLRDHGRSDKPQNDAHIDTMAADLVGLIDALHLDRVHVLGSSLGAEVGLALAANHPGRVRSLVCEGALASEYGPYGTWQGTAEAFEQHVADFLASYEGRADRIYPSVQALVAESRPRLEQGRSPSAAVQAYLEYDACEIAPGQFTHAWSMAARRAYFKHYFTYRFEDYYRRVACPLLMLPGEQDLHDEATLTAMRGLASLAPQARIVELPGWEHPYAWLFDPAPACRAILPFLAEAA